MKNLSTLDLAAEAASKMINQQHAKITLLSYRSRWDAVHCTAQVFINTPFLLFSFFSIALQIQW